MKKILFLDHDGVICLAHNWGSRFDNDTTFDDLDFTAVQTLNEIIQATDCDIVISSDWRFYENLDYLKQFYMEQGIIKQPIDTTIVEGRATFGAPERNRAGEIEQWVTENLTPEDRWVSVDDLNMKAYLQDNFVLTSDFVKGIAQEGIKEEIIKILNR